MGDKAESSQPIQTPWEVGDKASSRETKADQKGKAVSSPRIVS